MSFAYWLSRLWPWFSPDTRRRQGRPLRRFVPRLEALEDRTVPSFLGSLTLATGASPYAVAAADFNGDGKKDLAVTNENSDTVSVLLGKGDGTFGAATNFAAGDGPNAVKVADFDGDGRKDLAITNDFGGGVYVLRGKGDGTFQQP